MVVVANKRRFSERRSDGFKKEREDSTEQMMEYLKKRRFYSAIFELARRLNYRDFSRGLWAGIKTDANLCYLSSSSKFFGEMLQKIMSIFQKVSDDPKKAEDELKEYDPRQLYPFFDAIIYSARAINGHCYPSEGSHVEFFKSSVHDLLTPVGHDKKIEQLRAVAGFFNLETLNRFMMRVNDVLEESTSPLCITFSAASHLFSLFYDPDKKRFIFIDPNRLPAKEVSNLKHVVERVYRIGTRLTKKNDQVRLQDLTSKYTSFGISFIGVRGSIHPEKLPSYQQMLTKKEFSRLFNMKINGELLLYYAGKYGDTNRVEAIVRDKKNYLKNLFLPISLRGRLSVIGLILNHVKVLGKNENQTLEFTLFAARNGHIPLISFLSKLDVSLESNYKGLGSLENAPKEGYLKTLRLLISLKKVTSDEIARCLEQAIQNGRDHIAHFLMSIKTYKKQLTKSRVSYVD